MANPDLVTLSQTKSFLGITDSSQDAKLSAAITSASAAVRSYAGRGFGIANVTETRTYQYDRSGWLDIDDCTTITAVTLDAAALTLNQTYVPGPDLGVVTPDGGSVFEWLQLAPWMGISPEMGFTRNLDTYWIYGPNLANIYSAVAVNATFGWPTIPADVTQAALWTVAEFGATLPEGYQHLGISSYSVTQNAGTAQHAIPDRARDLLASYKRVY